MTQCAASLHVKRMNDVACCSCSQQLPASHAGSAWGKHWFSAVLVNVQRSGNVGPGAPCAERAAPARSDTHSAKAQEHCCKRILWKLLTADRLLL
jgi:hypothetical protein